MSWDFSTEPEFEASLEWMRGFVREHVFPLELLDLDRRRLKLVVSPLQEEVKARGLWAAHLPPELGGTGFGQLKLGLMHEIIGESPLAPYVFGNNAPDSGNSELIALAIRETGREDQAGRWLRPLLSGDLSSAFSMTEPHTAGSDPHLLQTTAVLEGDSWVINGHKWFTTHGSSADILIVMALTDPDAARGKRHSMIIVPADTEGVDVVRDISTMEHPSSHYGTFWAHSEVRYRDVRVPADNLLGQRGAGFRLAQERLGPGRIHHAMRWLGQANRAYRIMCERAVSRTAHGGLLADKQSVQNWIAMSKAEMHAARLMTLHAAWTMDQAGASNARVEISMIKYFGARVLHDVIDRAIQTCGSLGYSADLPLEAMYRAARSARIYDGPDEVHMQSVARSELKRFTASVFPHDHVPTRRAKAVARYGDLVAGYRDEAAGT
ncbi:acyl-CoA dehydrogenase family protein [Nonomuraea cavernae]|uniref:acyl-CoA dehydrogenase family protein n=1 Tax=Nonomuraea cavernae TaxID=2045107 RepID=UPI0033C4C63A